MSKATLVRVNSTERDIGHRPSLLEAQKLVGGYIEIVRVKGKTLIVDEDGKIKNKPVNRRITDLYGSQIYGGYIVGDVIVLEGWKIVAA